MSLISFSLVLRATFTVLTVEPDSEHSPLATFTGGVQNGKAELDSYRTFRAAVVDSRDYRRSFPEVAAANRKLAQIIRAGAFGRRDLGRFLVSSGKLFVQSTIRVLRQRL